ncbi:MAG: VWA domain-containing protein [Gemmatimonadaceae bacterium]|nr:VWA domain-containing protein [Gemmatimonadaceae bacterium]
MRIFPDHPGWLMAGAGAAIVLLGLAWWAERRRRTRLARYAAADLLALLAPASALAAGRARRGRLAMFALLAGIALAGPRWGQEKTTVRREGIDVALVVDASLSMLAPDERPSRLARVKQEIRRLRASGPGDRFALIAFAGRAYLLTPLTADGGALELYLDNLDPSVVGQAGSMLAPALRQAHDLLAASRGGGDRAIVVLSDGEIWDDAPAVDAEAARIAQAGMHLVSVGVGSTGGSTIPMADGSTKRDDSGQDVVTKHDPTTLARVASLARGTYVATDATDKAARIRQSLSRLRAERRAIEETAAGLPRFHWFLWPAFAVLFWDARAGLSRRRRPTGAVAGPPAPVGVATRVAVALLGAGLAMGSSWPLPALQQGSEPYRRGDFPAAIREYRTAVQNGDRRPETMYNLGTALLAADSLSAAIETLERVARSAPADVRDRALFNLGLAHLKRARVGGDSAQGAAQQAAATYRQVLLAHPRDEDARWNYELAKRQQPPEEGGAPRPEDGGSARPEPQDGAPPAGGLSSAQARQLLENAARDERDTQERRQRRARPDGPPQGKDW